MCGIFGVLVDKGVPLQGGDIEKVVRDLLRLSETRGQEASGVATYDSRQVEIRKMAVSGRRFVQSEDWRDIFARLERDEQDPLVCIGHARLDTNSSKELLDENSPMRCGDVVGVHNGIIVNVDEVWDKYKTDVQRTKQVDSELPFTLIDHFTGNGSPNYMDATARTFGELEGSASIAALSCKHPAFVMATNTGSLFVANFEGKAMLFASEPLILSKVIERNNLAERWGASEEYQVRPGNGCYVDLETFRSERFELQDNTRGKESPQEREARCNFIAAIPTLGESDAPPVPDPVGGPWKMRYCTRCILPETMPLIYFDADGVCNYCNDYKKFPLKGKEALLKLVEPVRSKTGEPDIVLGFSGGRDSSYGLHYFKNELGMNPVAFTYDWAVITDLARRNQARIVGALGIEHVIVAADIDMKRRNIRQNVNAWLKRPELGLVTLFMAGDKQAEWYVTETAKKYNCEQIWMCRGNQLENEEFKWGYCGGITDGSPGGVIHDLSARGKFTILSYYFWNYLKNPSYFNQSLVDTAFAYFITYMQSHPDFHYLWHYVEWEEREIVDTLIKEYGWETDPGYKQSWRTDDGTNPWYNFIYYTMSGFTENDTFRSNQIREGLMSRDEAWRLCWEENKLRVDTMKWYFDAIGVDMQRALKVVESQPHRIDLIRKKRGES
jgi:hypothetical protein